MNRKQYNIVFTTLRDRMESTKEWKHEQLKTKVAMNPYYGLSVTDLRKLFIKYAVRNHNKNKQSSKTVGFNWISIYKAEATNLNKMSAFYKEEITHYYIKRVYSHQHLLMKLVSPWWQTQEKCLPKKGKEESDLLQETNEEAALQL